MDPQKTQRGIYPTLDEECVGLDLRLLVHLVGVLQVVHDVDDGRKVNHVLLAAAERQPDQVVEVVEGRPHHITWAT